MTSNKVKEIRARILAKAERTGFVTCAMARQVTGLEQTWYHLEALRKQGLLRHDEYNRCWKPTSRETTVDWEARFKRERADHIETLNLQHRAEHDLYTLIDGLKTLSNSIAAEAGRSSPPVYFALLRFREELDTLIYASDPCPAESETEVET